MTSACFQNIKSILSWWRFITLEDIQRNELLKAILGRDGKKKRKKGGQAGQGRMGRDSEQGSSNRINTTVSDSEQQFCRRTLTVWFQFILKQFSWHASHTSTGMNWLTVETLLCLHDQQWYQTQEEKFSMGISPNVQITYVYSTL